MKQLAWLGGIIDGEGSIGLKRFKSKRNLANGDEIFLYAPMIQITNCDMILINEVRMILKKNNIKFGFSIRDMKKRNPLWRNAANISISSYKSSVSFLNLVLPYLIAKKGQADILLDFCNKRIAINHRKSVGPYHKSYDGTEIVAWKKLHNMNHKGHWRNP